MESSVCLIGFMSMILISHISILFFFFSMHYTYSFLMMQRVCGSFKANKLSYRDNKSDKEGQKSLISKDLFWPDLPVVVNHILVFFWVALWCVI